MERELTDAEEGVLGQENPSAVGAGAAGGRRGRREGVAVHGPLLSLLALPLLLSPLLFITSLRERRAQGTEAEHRVIGGLSDNHRVLSTPRHRYSIDLGRSNLT